MTLHPPSQQLNAVQNDPLGILGRLLGARQMDSLCLDREGRILSATGGSDRYADAPLVVGSPLSEGFPELVGLEDLIAAIADGEQDHWDLRGLSRGEPGQPPRVYFDLQIVGDGAGGAIAFLEDVSDRLSLEQSLVQYTNEANLLLAKLAAEQEYSRQLVTAIADALITTDQQGAIETVNPAATALLGYTPEELAGQPLHLLLADPTNETILQAASGQGGQHNLELSCYTKSGEPLLLAFSCAVADLGPESAPRYIYLLRDITQRHRTQQRLGVQYAVARAIAESKGFEQVMQLVLRVFCEWLEWERGEYWAMDAGNTGQLRCLQSWEPPSNFRMLSKSTQPSALPSHPDPLVQRAISLNAPVWRAQNDPTGQDLGQSKATDVLSDNGMIFAWPLASQDLKLGALLFFSRERRSPEPDLDPVAMNLGSQIAQFVLRKQAQAALRINQMQTERLLLNILPPAIVDRLKSSEHSLAPTAVQIAEEFSDASVLFADIVGFTNMAENQPASETVSRLNRVFSAFDRLSELHSLEKIKTIGDAYMVVGGLPEPRPDHLTAIANMALDMLAAITEIRTVDGWALDIRIGIHTGSVVAGVIGLKKFAYDLWGDTVNVASRMESQGIPGAIQVTRTVYERLKDQYRFESRGKIAVKGKGTMEAYLLRERFTRSGKEGDTI